MSRYVEPGALDQAFFLQGRLPRLGTGDSADDGAGHARRRAAGDLVGAEQPRPFPAGHPLRRRGYRRPAIPGRLDAVHGPRGHPLPVPGRGARPTRRGAERRLPRSGVGQERGRNQRPGRVPDPDAVGQQPLQRLLHRRTVDRFRSPPAGAHRRAGQQADPDAPLHRYRSLLATAPAAPRHVASAASNGSRPQIRRLPPCGGARSPWSPTCPASRGERQPEIPRMGARLRQP